jgi:nucleotidyltransferase substrate binding protein (TIGR01987 family)
MTGPKTRQGLDNLGRALDRLREALAEPDPRPLAVDGTIQRFEFVIELFWKTLKRLLAEEGITADTPRDAVRKAFQVRWLSDEATWLEMLDDRNRTSHVYDEAMARRIHANVQRYFPEMERVYRLLQQRGTN